jgi:hypothetical protein
MTVTVDCWDGWARQRLQALGATCIDSTLAESGGLLVEISGMLLEARGGVVLSICGTS